MGLNIIFVFFSFCLCERKCDKVGKGWFVFLFPFHGIGDRVILIREASGISKLTAYSCMLIERSVSLCSLLRST